MLNIKSLKFLIIIYLFLSFNGPCLAANASADKIVAIVNDMIVTRSEVQEFINFSYLQLQARFSKKELENRLSEISKEALVKIIEDKLILQEAYKQGLIIPESVIEVSLQALKSTFTSEDDFRKALLSQNMSLSDIKKNFKEQELMRAVIDREIRSKIQVSPVEITSFYNAYPERVSVLQGLEVSFVFFQDESEARLAIKEIKKGGNFNMLFSKHENYKPLFEVRKGILNSKVEDKLFKLSPGQVSNIVEFQQRFYLFKILKYLPPKNFSLAEAQDMIYKTIYKEKFSSGLMSWLDELKNQAYIVIK